ncbi:hypothetical protein CDLVIII_5659 [Clostridium sp. DL-VIII]|uniref:hypothetical protein n=1 Tax=Clostridium sp. DL-VIII TaxID=641107 RepID=UPI00023B0730|nr:hypothetical protein [Clostridium sp. DL-VIII]EHJ02129.1 hypothetical protein CDLVIII_5659 [Clostridium sp. DL-VIII]
MLNYVDVGWKIKENIPKEIVEYFDEMDQSNMNKSHCFHVKKVEELGDIKNITTYMEKNINYRKANLYGFNSYL